MNHLIYPLITLLTEWMKPRYNARLRVDILELTELSAQMHLTQVHACLLLESKEAFVFVTGIRTT